MPKQNKSTPLKFTHKKIERLKQDAKKLKKEKNISQAEALDIIARNLHFPNWKAIQSEAKKEAQLTPPTPLPSLDFINSEDIILSDEDRIRLVKERHAELQDDIKINITENRVLLSKKGIEYSIFEPTVTGLKKSILDATQPVRTHFKILEFHDYGLQKQGGDYKIIKEAFFVNKDTIIKTKKLQISSGAFLL